MSVSKKLYEGKAKILYATDDPDTVMAHFKDDATAFNGQKQGSISGKGAINCTISAQLFELLEYRGIPTHFLERVEANKMRLRRVQIVPLEVIVRNVAAGSLCKQTGLAVGTVLKHPLVEFFYKNDDLGDPLLTRDRLLLLELATPEQLEQLKKMTLLVNDILSDYFQQIGIILVDFKLEFGFDSQGKLLLADEISPDTCRLWNRGEADPNRRVMDKDRFRFDLGEVDAAYQQVLERVLSKANLT